MTIVILTLLVKISTQSAHLHGFILSAIFEHVGSARAIESLELVFPDFLYGD